MPSRFWSMMTLLACAGVVPAQPVDYSALSPPEVYVFPTPRQATYGPLDIEISTPEGPRAAIVLPTNAAPTLRAAAEDLNAALLRLAPAAQPLPVVEGAAGQEQALGRYATLILLGSAGSLTDLDAALAQEGLPISASDPGPQGYHMAVHPEGPRRLVLLGGSDDQGAYWAAGSFAQLLRADDGGAVRAHSARIRDWPAFARRMTTVEAVYESNHRGLESMRERMSVILGLKYNVSCYSGDSRELNEWLRPRGFRAGTGYWAAQGVARQAAELGLKPFNWGDERVLKAWEEQYARFAAVRPGLAIWHDATDAGWFNKYLDQFWSQRDEGDRQRWPEETPARADAERCNRIYRAVKAVSPDTDLYFTVPCYYDSPQDEKLPRVAVFREYLRTLGALTPRDIVWVLEDRGPLDIAAYQHYLQGRCLNYRYPLSSHTGVWSTNYTSAKHAVGYTDSYWFCTGHYEHDLLTACAAEYLWNPDVPEDYRWITTDLVPRACRFLWGSAWREMAEFVVNLNIDLAVLQEGRQVELVRAGQEKVARAVALLTAALEKCEPRFADGREGIRRQLQQMEAAQRWLGDRLALSEAAAQCQRAEELAAFGQIGRAQETADQAARLLARVTEKNLQQFGFLKSDHDALRTRLNKLRQTLETGTVAEGQLGVLPLDGQWQFKLDPGDEGLAGRWFAAEFARDDWAHIGVPGLWEQSGVAGAAPDYDGVAWYARGFRIPPGWQGKKIVLRVGACDDEAWAWVNGQFAGEHLEKDHPTVAWEEPFELDITALVKWEGDNLLVVRVNDTRGGGGIWRSVLLRADEPDRPGPGPGEVEVRVGETSAHAPAASALSRGAAGSLPVQASALQPGWSEVLTWPGKTPAITFTLSLLGPGADPEHSAGRSLTDEEQRYLAEHRVGRLAITSLRVGETELVIQGRYPGYLLVASFNWDGYGWGYHSVDEAAIVRNEAEEAAVCRGNVFCANYGRFETWMRYAYELRLRADGLGLERLTLIPDHDSGFAPNRNGPPYGAGGAGCSVSNVRMALGVLPSSFRTALLRPFGDLPPRALDLDYASDRVVWAGQVEPGGYLAAYDAAARVYFALLPGRVALQGSLVQSDTDGYPGDQLEVQLTRTLVGEWAAGSQNTFERWFAAGSAESMSAAQELLSDAAKRITAPVSSGVLPAGG